MPSDNLEKFLKEKIEAVAHVPPRGSTWDSEAAWLKLQQNPGPVRKKRSAWMYYAAAVFVVGLLSGIIRQYWPNSPIITQPVVSTLPVKKILPPTVPTPTLPQQVNNSNIPPTSPEPEPRKPVIAADQQVKFRVEPPALNLGKDKLKPTEAVVASTPDTEQNIVPGNNFIDLATEPVPAAPQIKITVVLGAASSARRQNALADKNIPDKKRNKRLRFNIPGSETIANDYLALSDSSYKFPRLQAKIDF